MLNINNEYIIVKAKIDSNIGDVFKTILTTRGLTQQDFIENAVKTYVLNNINLILSNKGVNIEK